MSFRWTGAGVYFDIGTRAESMQVTTNPGLRYIRALGLDARLAGIEAAGIAVVDLADMGRAEKGLTAAAQRLNERGADVLILGCAGMVAYAPGLAQATGLVVIDPVHAATGVAIAAASARGG